MNSRVCRPAAFAAIVLAITAMMYAATQLDASAAQGRANGAAGNVANGRGAFTKAQCDSCHGTEGAGTAAAPRLAGTMLTVQAFTNYVRKPAGTMPARDAASISDRDLADVYAFLRVSTPPAAPKLTGRVDDGAALFKKVGCYECHANEGQGGANGPRIGPNPIPFERFTAYVRNPAGDMPPYTARVLSDQDLAHIYAFLQARPQPKAVNSIPLLTP